MEVTHNIKIDIVKKFVKPRVHAMQYDIHTRVVAITLLAGHAAFTPPDGTTFALSYRKADGTKGFYNQLADDVSAISVSENVVSVILAPQVLTYPGKVDAALVMSATGDDRLSTFPFEIHVEADPSAGTTESDDYFNCGSASGGSTIYYNSDTSVSSGASRKISKASTASWTSIGFHTEPKKNDLVISASGQMFKVTSVLSTYLTMSHLADLGGSAEAVTYTEQTLTPEQQAQARANIAAAALGDSGVYVLSDGESLDNVPESAVLVVDPGDTGGGGEGTIPEGMASYNGVVLPIIPEELKASYTSFVIITVPNGSTILLASPKEWYFAGGQLMVPECTYCTNKPENDEWVFSSSYTDDGSFGFTTLIWASHDIRSGSATATEIYFEGSDPVSAGGTTEESKPDVLYVRNPSTGQLEPLEVGAPDAVLYTEQTLTDEQQAQARANIGAAAVGENDSASAISEVVGYVDFDQNVKTVNHRGYSKTAPENTLPAYILSKKMGFNYAEADVAFTSDGVAVLLHDSTIDRTSNGSGSISGMTYEEASQYDYGSWKSEDYVSTKIPTFEEFIKLCRSICLYPYIELKSSGAYTEAQIQGLVTKVKQCGMRDKATWISFNSTFLNYVKTADPTARLGYLVSSVTSEVITVAQSLKNDSNEVYIGTSDYSDTAVNLCCDANIPMEVWTINEADVIRSLNPYITGVTSDFLNAGRILYDASMEPTLLDMLVDVNMENGANSLGDSTYDATVGNGGAFVGDTYENKKFVIDGSGYLTIPTDFMEGSNPWTIAFTIDNYTLTTNTYDYCRIARGGKDVPSIFYQKSAGGFMFKLGSTTIFESKVAWYDTEFLAPWKEGGALIFNFPTNEKTTFVFRNDGAYISLWVNGEMKAKQEASVYTSTYYASTFSIGDNAMVGADMAHMECSMLKAWNRALTAEEIVMLQRG